MMAALKPFGGGDGMGGWFKFPLYLRLESLQNLIIFITGAKIFVKSIALHVRVTDHVNSFMKLFHSV